MPRRIAPILTPGEQKHQRVQNQANQRILEPTLIFLLENYNQSDSEGKEPI